MKDLTMQERILKTLEDKLMIDGAYMEEEKTKDLEEQIKAVKEYKQGRAEK
jgi:hypothetical protein